MGILNMFKGLSIRIKLVTAFIFVLILMASVSGVQMRLFSGYIQDYNHMLEGIAKANAVNGMIKTDLDNEIRAITNGQKQFKDGKQYDLLKTMDEQLKQIKDNETDAQTLKQILSVSTIMESLRLKIDKLGSLLESKSSVDQQTAIFDNVVIINTSIQEGIQEVIRQKLIASEKHKQQIMADFTKGVWIYGAAFTFVIMLSFMTAWLISGSISRPLRRLSRSSTEMANGNLTLAVQAVFESILLSNSSVQQDVGTITQDMRVAGERMHNIHNMLSIMEEKSGNIDMEINGIAAMSQEQVATLQEVSASSDILVDQNIEMKRVVSIFSIEKVS